MQNRTHWTFGGAPVRPARTMTSHGRDDVTHFVALFFISPPPAAAMVELDGGTAGDAAVPVPRAEHGVVRELESVSCDIRARDLGLERHQVFARLASDLHGRTWKECTQTSQQTVTGVN